MIKINSVLENLLSYCRGQGYQGYDPYDGLNSRLFQLSPLNNYKITRQLWTHTIKRSPFNLRPILFIPKGYNSKGIALFILGLLNIYKNNPQEEYLREINVLFSLLKKLSIPGYSSNCWGYNFPWQSRSFFASASTPNAICSVFAVDAFLSAYEILGKEELLQTALNSIDFFLQDLKKSYNYEDEICFSYTPKDNSKVHNVNFWVAYILMRLSQYYKKDNLTEISRKAVEFSINRQNPDGSWYYGMADNQKWIDNFHTGYNLIALKRYSDLTGAKDFRDSLEKGYDFFDRHLFLKGTISKYYPDKVYPIDIHSVAVGIIAYLTLREIDNQAEEKAKNILSWALENMWDEKGFFYFQKHRFYSIKIPYIRWSQAWMFYALSFFN